MKYRIEKMRGREFLVGILATADQACPRERGGIRR
jgi:hypothetical protein